MPSLAVMLAKVQAYAATLEPGEWILGGGWDHTKWPGAKLPTRQELDAVSAGHPAFLERTDGHIAIANTAALTGCGDYRYDDRIRRVGRSIAMRMDMLRGLFARGRRWR